MASAMSVFLDQIIKMTGIFSDQVKTKMAAGGPAFPQDWAKVKMAVSKSEVGLPIREEGNQVSSLPPRCRLDPAAASTAVRSNIGQIFLAALPAINFARRVERKPIFSKCAIHCKMHPEMSTSSRQRTTL